MAENLRKERMIRLDQSAPWQGTTRAYRSLHEWPRSH